MDVERPDRTRRDADDRPALRIDGGDVALEQVVALARGHLRPELSTDPAFRARLEAGRAAFERALAEGRPVYGVTTGVGASVTTPIPPEERKRMPLHLLRFHGCGTGRRLDDEEAAAVVAVRLVSLARGWSAVRPVLLERLCALLARGVRPCIPEEGSVGASGDLTPLSYLAALLAGEREARLDGEERPAAEALARAGLEPLELQPKESLALMNGTAVMTAIGCLAWERARRLARLACAVTAMASRATAGNPGHFEPRIFASKPHAGTVRAAAWIRADLAGPSPEPPARLQDRYSIRCAPHVIGVLLDALDFQRGLLEVEVNGADDNPLVDPEHGCVLHGGNFYGGHVAFAMDGLKAAVAGVADLLDRQLQLLCAPETSGGLPPNLIRGAAHHGMKAMQISTSALAAEALKLTMPAASFSRSTEGHNQDKVSMGTIAARDARRVVELTETVAAMALLAGCQALDLRGGAVPGALGALRDAVRARVPRLEEDRRQDRDVETVRAMLREDALPLPLEPPAPV
ncbi:MAG: aromatic amino acid ammonia-lyase [Myxococcota bacterium]|nr:aromatic amino acid ammonia-lyase [Myxococcota bacterium]